MQIHETNNYDLTYETEITDNVLGYLDEYAVAELLIKIEQLEKQ